MIADTVAALDRSLHGPARLRRDMLREVSEGLTDAAEAYRDAGVAARRADELAVHDFGPVAGVAAQLQGELAAAQARRVALLLTVTFPALLVSWDLAWSSGVEWGHAAPSLIRVLAWTQDAVSAAVAVTAAGLLLLGLRRTAAPGRVAAAVGGTALGSVVLTAVLSLTMNLVQADDLWALVHDRPQFLIASVLSVAAGVAITTMGVRTVRAARRATGAGR